MKLLLLKYEKLALINDQKKHGSPESVIQDIPDSKIIETIRYYRSVIRELESVLSSRSLAGIHVTAGNNYDNVRDIGSLKYIDPEAYFSLGFAKTNIRNGKRRRNSNRLATIQSTGLNKMQTFINKLTLTEDEKVNLLEEWVRLATIIKGE